MSTPARLLAAARPIRPALIILADLVVAALAPILAHWIRQQDLFDFDAILTYWVASMLCSGACFLVFGLERSIWRYLSWRELVPLTTAVVTAVSSASFVTFSLDRMHSVSRSEPMLHAAILLAGLVLIRVIGRQAERSKRSPTLPGSVANSSVRQALVIGTSPLADLYLRMVDEMAYFSKGPVDVVGIVAEKSRHLGRSLRGRPITGTIAEIESLILKLTTHGVRLDLVVLAIDDKYLSNSECESLKALEADGVEVVELRRLFGGQAQLAAEGTVHELELPPELGTWCGKRLVDIALCATILICLSPFVLPVWACVLADIGPPVIFWQIRPGFRGVPIRFYKIRTMRHIKPGKACSDHERISLLGGFLRRTRFDELPQLINILLGQMSFVGPRPLLPRDLHEVGAARIRMRPGVTGWAQVNGGKLICAKNKMALDLWYAYHASFRLDLIILWRTVLTVLHGDRVRPDAINQAQMFLELEQHLSERGPTSDFHPRKGRAQGRSSAGAPANDEQSAKRILGCAAER